MIKIISDAGKITLGLTTRAAYTIECECGNRWNAFKYNVDAGKVTKCKSCRSMIVNSTHGKSKSRLYRIYIDMKKRCYNKNSKSYNLYGGSGITICQEWLDDYEKFEEWSISNGYSDSLEIDRINNNSSYSPDNCRWTTKEVNLQNRRLLFSSNTSGYRGVSWHKTKKKWIAKVGFDGKRKQVGCFDNAEDAAISYNKFVIENNLHHPLNEVHL